jgi:FdhD protein
MAISRQVSVLNWDKNTCHRRDDQVAMEVPVALTFNKQSHVVMMATPADLEDFAIGFSLTEGILGGFDELAGIKTIPREEGLEVAMTVTEACFARLARQRRNLVGRTGCGLCGAESLEQAMRSPAVVASEVLVSNDALQVAVKSLGDHQPLQAVTGAVHGAAWCNLEGEIQLLREDVGRHNALDKLIGHLSRVSFDSSKGFLVVSSRASYEMVYKAASVGIELLLAVSAATTLAIDFAHRSGMTLVGFGRPGRHNVYTFEQRIKGLQNGE